MGRYITGSGAGGGGAGMRNERHVITANTPALAVPVWAKLVKVSGVGAGGGGGNNTNADVWRAAGGGSGGIAKDALLIVAGETIVSIAIGTPGAGAAGGSNAAGANGGDTVITMGAKVITLHGGGGGSEMASGSPGAGGRAHSGATDSASDPNAFMDARAFQLGLSYGIAGERGDEGGRGAPSLLGQGGEAYPTTPVPANNIGGNAVGHGAGGAGGKGSGKGGDGAPGIAIIEFLEAA